MSLDIDQPKAVNVKRASELLGITGNAVRRLIREGQLGAVKLGKCYVVPVEEIDRVLAPARQVVAS